MSKMDRSWLLAVLLALALAGCGEGSSGGQTAAQGQPTTRILPEQQFIQRAKAICAAAQKKMGEESKALLEQRASETGEPFGLVGEVEAVPETVVPMLRRELRELKALGLPEGKAYEAEALWQTIGIVLHEVEVEGIYAWRSAKLLVPFRNRAKPFDLEHCILN